MMNLVYLVSIIAIWVYILNLKDVYYAYGRAVALKQAGAKITYDGSLTFTFPNGNTEVYMDTLAKSTMRLFKKNGIEIN
jgi:hypothetical protein